MLVLGEELRGEWAGCEFEARGMRVVRGLDLRE